MVSGFWKVTVQRHSTRNSVPIKTRRCFTVMPSDQTTSFPSIRRNHWSWFKQVCAQNQLGNFSVIILHQCLLISKNYYIVDLDTQTCDTWNKIIFFCVDFFAFIQYVTYIICISLLGIIKNFREKIRRFNILFSPVWSNKEPYECVTLQFLPKITYSGIKNTKL